MKAYSWELYFKNNLEISLYWNISLILLLTWFNTPFDKERRRIAFQIGILGINLRITYFKQLQHVDSNN